MLSDILKHLREVLSQDNTPQVEVVEDIDALAEIVGRLESGAVIIVPWRERASANPLASGGFRQHIAVQFLAGVVIRTFDQMMGEERALQFDEHRRRLERALAGWSPPAAVSPCQLVDAESSPVSTGVSIFVQTWETARILTGEQTS
ncbi:MAG: hypothetical protein DI498_10975 [Paracoccus denitrificans]|nr:MAG: hypothetical protein DI498_10975 [Paracoccus denitrificans]PZO83664.1 MAG: hypothetical protein DI633_10975 [Paracoccus denitrificans]